MPSTSESATATPRREIRILMVAGPKGGVGRTSICVRLAEQFKSRGIPPVLIDLTPNPTAQFVVSKGSFPVAQGRGASTVVSARAILRPFEESAGVVLLDTSRLDDPLLIPWAEIATHLLVVTSANAHGLGSLRTIWEPMQKLREKNENLNFLGFLPTFARSEDRALLDALQRRPDMQILSPPIEYSNAEIERFSSRALGQPGQSSDSREPVTAAYAKIAEDLIRKMGLKPISQVEAEKPATGVIGKLWRMAAKALGPRATLSEAGS